MKKVFTYLLILFVLLILFPSNIYGAVSFNFNDGTKQGWTMLGAFDANGSGPFQSNFTLNWTKLVNNPTPDPNSTKGSLLFYTPGGHGVSGASGSYWIMELHSPDLSTNSSWQTAKGFSVKIVDNMTVSAGDLWVNLWVKVYDYDQSKDRNFYSGTAQKLTHSSYFNTNAVWNDLSFDWSGISNFPTNFKIKEISIKIWGLLTGLYEGQVAVDEVVSIGSQTTSSIVINEPNGGEKWYVGSFQDIWWTNNNFSDPVKIEYSTNGGSTYKTIVSSATNSGTYKWTVPNEPSSNCLVRVSDAADANPTDVSNAAFTILSASLTLTFPNGGETWQTGSQQTISWNSQNIPDNDVKIEYSIDNGKTYSFVDWHTNNEAAEAYTWDVPNTTSSQCLIRISLYMQGVLISDVSNAIFTIGSSSATKFDFNDGTKQGWTMLGAFDANGSGPFQSNFTLNWTKLVNNPTPDPNSTKGSLLFYTPGGHGVSGASGSYWIMELHSPDLSTNSSWQSAKGFSVKIVDNMTVSAGDLWVNLWVKVYDYDQSKDRYFYSGTAQKLTHSDYFNTNAVWNDLSFDWSGISSFPTNFKIKEISIKIWGLLSGLYEGQVGVDEITAKTGGITNNTNTGTNVQINLGSNVNILFDNVSAAGNTSMTTSTTGTTPPTGFTVVPSASPLYYSITTTASYSGNINLAIQYDDAGMTSQQEALLKLQVYETTSSQWKDITTSLDQNANIIYGSVTHLSEFAVMYSSGQISDTWTLTNQPINGTITCFTVSGSNLFAGTEAGGVFISTNNGTTWNPVNTGLTKYTVRALCANGTNIFAGTWGDGIFLSTNNGSSWTAVNTGLSNKSVAVLYNSGTTLLAGTWGGGVFLSTNYGSSWTAINSGITETHIRSLYISGNNFYAGSINGLFLSTNNGSSWNAINSGLTNTAAISLAGISATSTENLYTGTDGGGIFISTNNGTAWSGINSGLKNLHISFLAVSGANLFAATWGGGVFVTTDNGSLWSEANDGLTNKYIRSIIVSGTYIYAGADDGGIYRRLLAGIIPGNTSNHFVFSENTGDSYSIVIDTATVNDIPLNIGDEIGVFTPAGLCVGASIWDGNTPLALTAWGDDTQTAGVDGYVAGEQMSFKIWSSNTNIDYSATTSYSQGNGNFGYGYLAHISKLSTSSTIAKTFNMAKGWSWISFNIKPVDLTVDSVFSGAKNLAIVVNNKGQFYVPGVINNIGNLNILEGYKVYFNSQEQLSLTGQSVSANTSIPLISGWNFISYLPNASIAVETALNSILPNLAIIKNDDGNFFVPNVVNNLNNMSPGEGYKLYLNSIDTLIYTSGSQTAKTQILTPLFVNHLPRHFTPCTKTGESYSIVIQSIALNGLQLETGDEIGIFTESGLCVGATVLNGNNITGIAAWSDDQKTGMIDGYQSGEEMVFKLWCKEINKEITLYPHFLKGNGKFGDGAFASVELDGNSAPGSFNLLQNYPNPFNSQTLISFQLPGKETVELKIFDLNGREIRTLINKEMEGGTYRIRWDGLDRNGNLIPSGIYFYRLKTKSFISTKKAIMLK